MSFLKTTTILVILFICLFASYLQAQNLDSLKNELTKSTSLEQKLDNTKQIASVLMNSENTKALKYSFDALKLSEQLNDTISIAEVLDNIGEIHRRLGNFDSTEYYLNKSIELKKQTNNETLHNI